MNNWLSPTQPLTVVMATGTIGRMERPDHSRKKQLEPHQVPPGKVASLVNGSVLTAPLFHSTSLESREEIVERGIDLFRNRTAIFGRGFYLSSKPIERYGPGVVCAAVKLQNPLVVPLDEFTQTIENWGVDPDDPDAVRDAVLSMGFDGIIVKGADFNRANEQGDIIVVIDVRTVRIIAE
jgi:hypothetical protein